MKNLLRLICFFCVITQGFSQLNLVPFEQIDSLQKIEKRPVIVFIHAHWCKYCKVMQNKTFKNATLINLINTNFYFVSFDAEEKRKINFNHSEFNFKPNGSNSGIHELAIALGTQNNQVNYPVLCILNDKNEIILQHTSFLNAKDLIFILRKLKG